MDLGRWTELFRADAGKLSPQEMQIRDAAWIARCVGRGGTAPLGPQDVAALASRISSVTFQRGERVFGDGGGARPGVCIVRSGHLELGVVTPRGKVVVGVLRPGDVDGDVPLLLGIPVPYAAHALDDAVCLMLSANDFESLLDRHPGVSRRWLSSVAQRLATSHGRLISLLGRPLLAQLAGLLVEEAEEGTVRLPQRTLAAMLGVARPSLNKVLKDLERRGYVRVGYGTIEVLDERGLVAVRDV
ncbi:cAMP-binding domain of CRP or a regulatory subunit of cAMP-dependent protein kinases [Blastococcus sp. DSM 46786]|uniref:Crp/Fnr family transcriptional regulator n=1 Tax=Blastococcus sp. DSM 46786 TaxID=1798227 RepID=UPI0008BA8D20|nr:Crp/Fnr family transcriptional regulator [Blastococcus sp. DSM 46786]SEL12924.1 cAMP-binding domain of CRP or a regulatory subunit of cAMP-dependent protein kinases [Blastococcus sp. DSM 46786]